MKKSVIFLISFVVFALSLCSVSAKPSSSRALSSAIRLYKSGNYVQSYDICKNIVSKDPSNAVAYYYLAISSVRVGKKDEALQYYSKVIDLSSNVKLTQYATKGKVCIETPEKCSEFDKTNEDTFVTSGFKDGFSNAARSEYEKKKMENLMREINRGGDFSPSKLKDYKDFSSEAPTNDEIVNALRVLQRAGLNNILTNNYYGNMMPMNANNSDAEMLNLLTGNDSSKLSPQLIRTMLTNQMGIGF